jgi:hypothetical protein
MRNARIVLGLAVAACVLGVSTASALAVEFTASKISGKGEATFPLKLRGVGVGPQEFVFKKIHVTCQSAKASGEIPSASSPTIELVVTYKECMTGPIIVFGKRLETPMKFKSKSEYTFHTTGWVENESEVEMKAKYIGCLVDWDSGTYPEKAEEKPENEWTDVLYKNEEVKAENVKKFPSEEQHKLLITNKLAGLEWEEEGGGICEDPEIELAEGEKGRATGSILVEVPGGNIEGPETG